MTSLDIYQSSNTPKFCRETPYSRATPYHPCDCVRKPTHFWVNQKNTPMTCKPREKHRSMGKFCNKVSELSQMLWCASHTLYYNGIRHAVAPRVYYRRTIIYNISTHYSTSKRTCIEVIQDCSRVNRIVFMHIYAHLQSCSTSNMQVAAIPHTQNSVLWWRLRPQHYPLLPWPICSWV